MLSPTTPAKQIELVVRRCSTCGSLPPVQAGSAFASHVFRGRLGVHACYGLPTRRRPAATLCLPGSDRFVTSAAAGIATRPGRPLPGQDLHLLEQRTFHGAPGPLH